MFLLGNFPAKAAFTVPPLTGPVVDLGHIITPRDGEYLDQLIRRVHDVSQIQLQVLTVPSLDGEPIEQASIAVTDKWKLGTKGSDKGVLLLVSVGDKAIRIEVGQGLEGDLPDVYASRIIHEVMTPRFREGDMSGGVVLGVQNIAGIVAPEVRGTAHHHQQRDNGKGTFFILFLWILLMLISRVFMGRWGYLYGGFGGGGFLGGGGGFGGGGGGWSGGGGGFSGGGASGGW